MRHRIFVPLASDPTKYEEVEALAEGDGCFRLAGRARSTVPLQYKPGEIVECSILPLPNGSKGLVATRSVSSDPEYRSRRTVFAVLGAIVGAVFGAAFALWFEITSTAALVGATIGAITFALCSVRWGDRAWEILSHIVRWR
jgi:hypothetical protein